MPVRWSSMSISTAPQPRHGLICFNLPQQEVRRPQFACFSLTYFSWIRWMNARFQAPQVSRQQKALKCKQHFHGLLLRDTADMALLTKVGCGRRRQCCVFWNNHTVYHNMFLRDYNVKKKQDEALLPQRNDNEVLMSWREGQTCAAGTVKCPTPGTEAVQDGIALLAC